MWAVRCHLCSERGCHQSHPDMEARSYMGLSNGPSLNHAPGDPPSFGPGGGFLAEARPRCESLVLPALWPRSQPPRTHLGGHPHRGRDRTSTEVPSPSTPSAGWSARGAGLRAPGRTPWPPALLQMAGSSGWFANDQVRLKPQSLWLPAAAISHTVSDPIIATPPLQHPPLHLFKRKSPGLP